jgi:hypothetical protein
MKNTEFIRTLVLWLIVAVSPIAYGQPAFVLPEIESVHLSAARSLYISGENVQFSAYLTLEDHNQWLSRILYVEIITSEGKSISSGKYPVQNSASYGTLRIPEDIVSGVYYLRAYTKYMRNAGPESYAYLAIKIVNPRNEEVMNGNGAEKFILEPTANTDPFISIGIEKDTFSLRREVRVTLAATTALASEIKVLSISVVPSIASDEYRLPDYQGSRKVDSLLFYPETRGLSMTGELKDISNGKPVPGSRVNISIIGKGRDFMVQETDISGRFFFSLPAYTGTRDVFLCSGNTDSINARVLVDNDFCTMPVRLPGPVFGLSSEERSMAFNMALNCQISKGFSVDSIGQKEIAGAEERAFYGKPNDILRMDDYVQLPTLEEYFNELPGMVKIRKKNGKKYFKVIGKQQEMNFFDPLVMIDWVAVEDPQKILAAAPVNIARIEMINEPYVKGNIIYGGIVSIISKRGDFAGIDLPSSGIFIRFPFLSDLDITDNQPSSLPNIPDTRNTAYWQPDLVLKAGEPYRYSFITSDTPGKYAIILKGLTSEGLPFRQVREFTVLKKD